LFIPFQKIVFHSISQKELNNLTQASEKPTKDLEERIGIIAFYKSFLSVNFICRILVYFYFKIALPIYFKDAKRINSITYMSVIWMVSSF